MIQDAVRAIQLEAVDYFNFNCGIANFVRLSDIAEAAGIPCWHGSEVDLGILEASYASRLRRSSQLHFAQRHLRGTGARG